MPISTTLVVQLHHTTLVNSIPSHDYDIKIKECILLLLFNIHLRRVPDGSSIFIIHQVMALKVGRTRLFAIGIIYIFLGFSCVILGKLSVTIEPWYGIPVPADQKDGKGKDHEAGGRGGVTLSQPPSQQQHNLVCKYLLMSYPYKTVTCLGVSSVVALVMFRSFISYLMVLGTMTAAGVEHHHYQYSYGHGHGSDYDDQYYSSTSDDLLQGCLTSRTGLLGSGCFYSIWYILLLVVCLRLAHGVRESYHPTTVLSMHTPTYGNMN